MEICNDWIDGSQRMGNKAARNDKNDHSRNGSAPMKHLEKQKAVCGNPKPHTATVIAAGAAMKTVSTGKADQPSTPATQEGQHAETAE